MEQSEQWQKGDLVPGPGTYRCTGSGEIWVTEEANVRFPPCDVCKDGSCRWERDTAHR